MYNQWRHHYRVLIAPPSDDYYAFLVTAGLAKYIEENGTTNRILQISTAEWKKFLADPGYNLPTDLVEYDPVRTDMVALLKGFKRVSRDKYHVKYQASME